MNLCHVTLLVTYHVLSSHAQFPNMAFPNPMAMGMPMPGMSMPGMPMPGMPMPGMPMPGMPMSGMPMQIGGLGSPRMPSIVMPYHSKKADSFRKKHKRQRRRRQKHLESYSTSSSSSSSSSFESSSSDENNRPKDDLPKRRQVLTPVISYVTKDGYVVYEKRIKKDRAKDWLELGKNSVPTNVQDEEDKELEDKIRDKLEKMTRRNSKSKRKHHHD